MSDNDDPKVQDRLAAKRDYQKRYLEKQREKEADAQSRRICVGVDMVSSAPLVYSKLTSFRAPHTQVPLSFWPMFPQLTVAGAAYVSNANHNKPPETISRWGKGQHC